MTMNQQQTKYAREKINRIYDLKIREIEKKYEPKYLNTDQLLEALKAGQFTIKDELKKDKWGGSGYLRDFIEFDAEQTVEEEKQERDRLLKELRELKSKTMDELILGDVQEALALLRNFEEKEF